MTYEEALHEISTMVYRNTDDFSMRISKDCYKTIVSALQKHIPMKPTERVNCYPEGQYECSACRCGLIANKKWKQKYCPECGQTLDWSDTE